MLYQPLEQFEIVLLRPIKLGSLDFSFTNLSLYLTFAFGLFYFLFVFSVKNMKIIPTTFFQFIGESSYKFIAGMLRQQVGLKGQAFFVFVFTTFFFILCCNLIGMTPYGFTVTSHIIQTFMLSSSMFIGLVIYGFLYQNIQFLKLFWPTGVPNFLIPLLLVIEVISYLARAFSLAIRLFANMMSGHTLLNILSSFALNILGKHILFGILPLALISAIVGLELGIAVVQAYVFTILLCIYLNDSVNPKDH